jgi:hypothetical protein
VEALGNFMVQRQETFLHIHDKQDHGSGIQRQLHLVHGRTCDHIAAFFTLAETNAAGIDQCEGSAAPLRLHKYAVACHAWFIMDDGDALADNTVE